MALSRHYHQNHQKGFGLGFRVRCMVSALKALAGKRDFLLFNLCTDFLFLTRAMSG